MIYHFDFRTIVTEAWNNYDDSRNIKRITDISAKVSTNHVYKVNFEDKGFVIAKLSYFGQFEHFVEDHQTINSLSTNLPAPFENFLARSLVKENKLYVYRYHNDLLDVWVVFYRPIRIRKKLPRRLDEFHITKLGEQFAKFHRACTDIRNTLPRSSKNLTTDIIALRESVNTPSGYYEFGMVKDDLLHHCDLFLDNYQQIDRKKIPVIPVFVDWNIGNFSVTKGMKLYSRWDYDWFRMSSRMMDFYFFSRIVSDVGDRTVFTYNIDVMQHERFYLFLKHYHKVFPLTAEEIDLLPEMYRFFLLNYVVHLGKYFFHELYYNKLQREAFEIHLPSIASFDTGIIKNELGL